MGGRGLVEAIQSRGIDIPVLVMSGYVNDAAWRQGGFPHGAQFIAKPFTGAEIARRVREVLDGAAAVP
jgi:DNA-binding response OmpR family regulator